MEYNFSKRISSLQPSVIREILKFSSGTDVVPFSAGNPAPEAFPVEQVKKIIGTIMVNKPVEALQYGVTEGYAPLLDSIKMNILKAKNIDCENDEVIITSGAQQVMDLATKILVNEGDTIVCENPTFIGSLNTFRSYNANLAGVPIEHDGMSIELLEKVLQKEKNIRFIYTIPNFQNPSGATMSLEKRRAVYDLAKKHSVLILEDNPYGDIRVDGEDIPSIKSMDKDGIVIYAGSFSKILSPGLRVGYMVAPKEIVSKATVGKQTSDVHTPVLNQMVVENWLSNCDFGEHIQKIRNIYRRKLNLMCDCIDRELGNLVNYVKPQGGLFVWCQLSNGIDMQEFCKTAVANGVAVVPGNAFLTDESQPCQHFRMNFSTPTDKQIADGMAILGKTIKNFEV